MALIWLVAITMMMAGGVRAARHRAHASADGAALAAAAHAAEGPAVACRVAATVATGTGARLTGCVVKVVPRARSDGLAQDGHRRRGLGHDGTGQGGLGHGRAGHDGTGQRGLGHDGIGQRGPGEGGAGLVQVSVVVTYRGPGWPVPLRIPARARAGPVEVDATDPVPPRASSSPFTRNLSSGHSLYTASME